MLFDHAFVINLDRRPERYAAFQHANRHLPFLVERFPAIDGKNFQARDGLSAFQVACAESHVAVTARAMGQYEAILVLEDDARFCLDLERRLEYLAAYLPGDWEHVYLGGFGIDRRAMAPVCRHIYRSVRTNGTHAYVLRRRAYRKVAAWLAGHSNTPDGMLADMIEARALVSYTFLPICAHQQEPSYSDLNGAIVAYNTTQLYAPTMDDWHD